MHAETPGWVIVTGVPAIEIVAVSGGLSGALVFGEIVRVTYVVSQLDGHTLTIGGKGGSAILVAMPQEPLNDLRASNLKFERTTRGNTLLEVQMAGKPSLILNRGAAAGK